MKVSTRGLVEIASHEGIVPYPYLDSVGVWTVGVGHAEVSGRPPNPRLMARGKPIPMDEVFRLFRDDIAAFAADVDAAVRVPVKQHEFDALTSFHYNTGAIKRASLTRLLNEGNRRAAADAFALWRKPPEIIPRRMKEQSLFRDGVYSSGGFASVYRANDAGRIIWSSVRKMNVLGVLGDDQKEAPITVLLRAGSVGHSVKRLQDVLGIIPDGIFGPQTLRALKDYQEDHGLTVDGIAGPQTLGHMGLT